MFPSTLTKDVWVQPVLASLAFVAGAVLLIMVLFLWRESVPALEIGLGQFAHADGWYPGEGQFGLLPMLWASLIIAGGAMLFAVPLGLACAIALEFLLPKSMAGFYRGLLGLMAGMPSVVLGLWGLVVLVPIIARWQAPGSSVLAATLVLTLMVLPTVALTSAAAFKAVPNAWLQGAAALGFSRMTTILRIALPAACRGISAGFLLAVSRAVGETLVVLMVAGNVVQVPNSMFDPVRTLTANIALEMAYAMDQHRAALFVSGLLLMALVLLLALLANLLQPGHSHAEE